MTKSWKSWNWKLWLLSLLVAGSVFATFGYRTLAENSTTVQLLTNLRSTVQTTSLFDVRKNTALQYPFYQLNLATLISKSTTNNPSPDKIYLKFEGKIGSPVSTIDPGVKPGDTVQLNSSITFNTISLELNRITNDGEVESVGNLMNLNAIYCDSSLQQFDFKDKKSDYTLNYSCSK